MGSGGGFIFDLGFIVLTGPHKSWVGHKLHCCTYTCINEQSVMCGLYMMKSWCEIDVNRTHAKRLLVVVDMLTVMTWTVCESPIH